MKCLFFTGLLAAGVIFSSHAIMEVYKFDTPEKEAIFRKLSNELRCPKCQNNNIADSNSSLARDLRMKVYEMLIEGKNESEITDYMIARYGNFIIYNPPVIASTLILWAGPALFVFGGFTVLVMRSQRSNASKNLVRLDNEEKSRLVILLNETVVTKENEDNIG
ncbi:cytochrome c-type biogenesis protein [Candidatus Enterovibrio escicola]